MVAELLDARATLFEQPLGRRERLAEPHDLAL